MKTILETIDNLMTEMESPKPCGEDAISKKKVGPVDKHLETILATSPDSKRVTSHFGGPEKPIKDNLLGVKTNV